jgi:hydroxymethylglutaryl-CoA lyase
VGVGTPLKVGKVVSSLIDLNLSADLAVHIHDTRGMGLVNAMAAFEGGIKTFDTAVGGMSAKPFGAPNQDITNWNIPTEDLVNMFESIGVQTDVNLDELLQCVSMAEKMLKTKCPGHILRAGANNKLFRPPDKLRLSHF